MKKIAKWIRHNQGIFASMIICAVLLVWGLGCQSKVASIRTPSKKITEEQLDIEVDQMAAELNIELDTLIRTAELKKQLLARQDELKRKFFELAKVTAATGTVNPVAVLAMLGSIIGAGAVVDNRIKDKVIKNRPLKGK